MSIVLLLLCSVHQVTGTAPPTKLAADTVLREYELRDASIQNIQFQVTYSFRSRRLRAMPLQSETQVIDATFEGNSRARFETMRRFSNSTTDQASKQDNHKIITWNRNELKTLFIDSANKPTQGEIISQFIVNWPADPRQLLYLQHCSPSEYLKSVIPFVDGQEEIIDGNKSLRISWESDPLRKDSTNHVKGSFCFAPALGYAVVLSELFRRPSTQADWKLVQKISSSNFVKVDDKWFPTNVELQDFTYYDKDLGHELTLEIHATFDHFKLPKQFVPSVFDTDFPDGTIVSDRTRKIATYVKGAINPKLIKSQVKAARQIAVNSSLAGRLETGEATNPFTRHWSAFTITLLAIPILIFAVMICVTITRAFRKKCLP